MSALDRVMAGITHKSGKGEAWAMARASYAYSRMHGLGILASLWGAIETGWGYL